MTERQLLIARKQAMQQAKNRVRSLVGIETLDLFERNANARLSMLYEVCRPLRCSSFQEPYSRLPHGSSISETVQWILETMSLRENVEYYYEIGSVWARIRLSSLYTAVQSLWTAGHYGFLLVETDFSRVLEAGFDSRDEEHDLIDIFIC